MFDENKENEAVNHEPENQEQITLESENQEQVTLEPENPYLTTEPEKTKKDPAVKVVIALAVVAVILLIAIIAVVASGVFNNKRKVEKALAETFMESGEYLEGVWNFEQYEGMFEDQKKTIDAELQLMEGIGLDMIIQQNEDVYGFDLDGSLMGTSLIEAKGYLDDSEIDFAVPNLLGYVFTVNRESVSEDIWNLVDIGMIDETLAEELIKLNNGQQEEVLSEEAAEELGKELLASWNTFYDKVKVEAGVAKELPYNGENRNCKSYIASVKYSDLAVFVEEVMDAIENNDEAMEYLISDLSAEYEEDDILDAFDEFHEDLKEMKEDEESEVDVEFYLCDGKVAKIYSEIEDASIEWDMEGGSFPLENTSIKFADKFGDIYKVSRTGSMENGEYNAEYVLVDEYNDEITLDIFYVAEDGKFELEGLADEESMIYMAGSMEKEDEDTVNISIDTLEVEDTEIVSGDIVIRNECDEITVPEGEERDVLTMSEDDWDLIIEELAVALMSMY